MKGAAQVCYRRPWRGDALSLTPALSRWERGKLRRRLDTPKHPLANQGGLRGSLSQRERAGVRENGHELSTRLQETELRPAVAPAPAPRLTALCSPV